MPAGLIEEYDRVRTWGNFACDFVEMTAWPRCCNSAARRQRRSRAGADRSKQIRQFSALIVSGAMA